MAAPDEADFVNYAASLGYIWTPRALPFEGRPILRDFNHWNISSECQRVALLLRERWGEIENEDIAAAAFGSLPDFEPWTRVGGASSPAYELNTCKRTATTIASGRLYYRPAWLHDGQVRQKDPQTVKDFQKIARWLRSRGKKGDGQACYIMPHALRAFEQGRITLIQWPTMNVVDR